MITTSYIPIRFPDGNVYPVKAGGYGGKKESKIYATESQLKKGGKEINQKVLNASIVDVQDAYTLMIKAPLAKKLVTFKKEKRTRKVSSLAKSRGKEYEILQVDKLLPGAGRLSVILPKNETFDIVILKYTPIGKYGAVRAWLYGEKKLKSSSKVGSKIIGLGMPFYGLDRDTIEKMIRQGCGLAGITSMANTLPGRFH